MKCLPALLLGFALLFCPGCKPSVKSREITPLQRKQAANLVSEAEFAVTLRDFARAEGLYRQAAELCPDVPEFWENLGVTRRRLNDRDGARTAYRQALAAHEERYERGKNTDDLLQQAWLLALLGRDREALQRMQKALAAHPDDPRLRLATDPKWLERLHADPAFKEIAL
jgi:Flp pilus assembly protein TadD